MVEQKREGRGDSKAHMSSGRLHPLVPGGFGSAATATNMRANVPRLT